MSVTLPASVCRRYERLSRFNSPYPAHDDGRAVDCYPSTNDGISPVAGTVRATRTVGCPDRPHAADTDHLIVVELGDDWCAQAGAEPGTVARILHVDPEVEPGDEVVVGDRLGPMTRSGFFGQWVANHVHLGFRAPGTSPLRASGSLPVSLGVDVTPVPWDGTGTVVETGPTHAVLDAPAHPASGRAFAALASDGDVPLDGGLTHYAGGGTFERETDAGSVADSAVGEPVSLLGTRVGIRTERGIAWDDVDVLANGERVTGLSLFASRDRLGVKLVCPDSEFAVGETVIVAVRESDDPIRLGVGR
ncbi:hypothetical protein JCM17823_21930 [Halorubrum gandharaense]